jgi:hypothetical protein
MAKTDKEETIEVMVAKGKSVDLDGVVNGPGSKITLSMSEAKDLYAKGFVVEPAGDDDEPDAPGPSVQIAEQAQ